MNRDRFEQEVKEYAKGVPASYPELAITPDHFNVVVTAKQTDILGNARTGNGSPYERARLAVSWDAYQSRGYSWERLRETVRHELCHINNWFVHGFMSHGPLFRELAKKLDCRKIESRYGNMNSPRYQFVNTVTGDASWNHYNCKRLRSRRDNPNYVVFESSEADIRDVSADWRESNLTAGLRGGSTGVDIVGGEVGAAADDN